MPKFLQVLQALVLAFILGTSSVFFLGVYQSTLTSFFAPSSSNKGSNEHYNQVSDSAITVLSNVNSYPDLFQVDDGIMVSIVDLIDLDREMLSSVSPYRGLISLITSRRLVEPP